MNQVTVFYNPFLPELRISINDKKVSPYSALMSYQHQRLEKWCESLFSEIYRELNTDYELVCISNEFTCHLLEELAARNSHCLGFRGEPLPIESNVYERLAQLELLGGEADSEGIVIPVINVGGEREMCHAVYEILEENGVFSDISYDHAVWEDCPLTSIELRSVRSEDDIFWDFPFAIALCGSEDDEVRIDLDAPIYVLAMGTETRFVKKKREKLIFTVDPDDISDIILQILEEEALCPLLSRLSYEFPADAASFLTESEKEKLALICQASPTVHASIPRICDVGRNVKPEICVYPSAAGSDIRIVSDSPDILEVFDGMLYPHLSGTARISVYIGADPYPAFSEMVMVQKRTLITDIKVFPSVLYMPLGESSRPELTTVPEHADNAGEISWESSDASIAAVDPKTGMISARACGRCSVTAHTADASACISVEVQPEIEEILCPVSYMEVSAGEQKEWRYTVLPDNAYGADLLRTVSSDKNIAEYRGGYIVGKSAGECKIYIKTQSGNISRELRVVVKRRKFW